MPSNDRSKRFQSLRQVPSIAAVDHRFFLDENGRDTRLAALSRKERRKLEAGGKKIGRAYQHLLKSIVRSGAGYSVDQLLRQLAVEYTHRYASSGLHTQPVSFNYFEAFCEIKLIEGSVAPYTQPVPEIDHLFSIVDYFDYITTLENVSFDLPQLKTLPEGKAFHYTPNGSIFDFTALTAEGREFAIAGFSMIRRGNSLHWFVVGGEVFSEKEWQELAAEQMEFEREGFPPNKRPFLSASMQRNGNMSGGPVALEGTATARKTIIAGETDLTSRKHLGRCYMSETENSFEIFCDDPEVFNQLEDTSRRTEVIEHMRNRVESAAVMWDLAEAMFQLPVYFSFKVDVAKSMLVSVGQKLPAKSPKGGRGVGTQFRYVSAIEFADSEPVVVRPYIAPHYEVETEGYWRRISPDKDGYDAEGSAVRGKTWIKATNKWRERPEGAKTIYVKSSVAAAKVKLNEYLARASAANESLDGIGSQAADGSQECGVLYVLRCTVMKDEVYKVGWTSGTAGQRARELSSATGVPSSFAVVGSWKHSDPEALEKGVHAMLAPYRITDTREFFQASYPIIKRIVEAEITRVTSRAPP